MFGLFGSKKKEEVKVQQVEKVIDLGETTNRVIYLILLLAPSVRK